MYKKLPRFGQHLVSAGIVILFLISISQLALLITMALGVDDFVRKDTVVGRTLQTVIHYTLDAPSESDGAFAGIIQEVKRMPIAFAGATHALIHQCIGDVVEGNTDQAYCVGYGQLLYENAEGAQFIIEQENVFNAPATTTLAWTQVTGAGNTVLIAYHQTPCPSTLVCAEPGDTTEATIAFNVTDATYITLNHYPHATLLWNDAGIKAVYVLTPTNGAMSQLWGYSLFHDNNELLIAPYEINGSSSSIAVAWSDITWQNNHTITATLTTGEGATKDMIVPFP